MAATPSGLFGGLGGLLLLAAIVCLPNLGVSGLFSVFIMLYGMLIAANSIDRGEKRRKRGR
jgi:uncharacterized membrane protein YdcZ (DUF606 family)